MTGWMYLRELHTVCQFHSKERTGLATNSELKRWLQNQTVLLNGRRIRWDEEVDFPVYQLVLHPEKCKTTIL